MTIDSQDAIFNKKQEEIFMEVLVNGEYRELSCKGASDSALKEALQDLDISIFYTVEESNAEELSEEDIDWEMSAEDFVEAQYYIDRVETIFALEEECACREVPFEDRWLYGTPGHYTPPEDFKVCVADFGETIAEINDYINSLPKE